ncbi:MAG TPA: valine--tRNA ligase [Thermomicrobiales bacterium]|nr:valine--tRNA ligase [Thermomicrobiales bacterium]
MSASQTSPAVFQTGELAKSYDPAAIEHGIYDWWDRQGYFQPSDDEGQEPFVVVMPPPNLTGVLHVGHALFVALEDIMVRYNRMKGRAALWIPGADHAGIAGQLTVVRLLAEEGINRHDIGREKFLERTWEYMDALRPRVREQMKSLGASADWTRFAFTMDPGPGRAVRHVFKHLYDKGLIYRGERIISWCPNDRTALSDLEVVYKEQQSNLWSIAYPVEGTEERIVVATTRPETMLGDTGVAVHPEDERYQHLVGKQVRLPLMGRLIPIVADEHVDMTFGTGAVKVTPAHDPNDFEIAKRADLPALMIMHEDGTLNAETGEFAGMMMAEGRKAVVARLEEQGFLVGIEPHEHSVGTCDRCGHVVEPLLSKQWFIKMAPLAKAALDAACSGDVTFVPERYKGVYTNWMENIHEWCISRQLWWGHQIPIWYCDACGDTFASVEESVDTCPSCGGPVHQDPDVLDTWFSSGLWPFSTLGWPEQTEDLRRFYPSDVLETGYEIIFTWVARMIFFGIEIMGEVPFHTVYLHGIVRDDEGAKMSKTKGNVIDPLEVSEEYGADALRYTLVTQASPGNDSRLSLQKVEAGRNFGNKLWNMTRFAMRSFDPDVIEVAEDGPARPIGNLQIVDRWIISRLDAVTAGVSGLMERHLYGEAGRQIADFLWSEVADWYIEAAKVRLREEGEAARMVGQVIVYVLERALRLLHPYMPFITETLWQQLPHAGESVMIAPWPEAGERDMTAERHVGAMMELVRGIRNARTDAGVEPAKWIAAMVYPGEHLEAFEQLRGEIAFLARVQDDQLTFAEGKPEESGKAITVVAGDVMASLPLEGMVDLGVERERLEKELEEARAEQQRAEKQLSNESFVSRAPEHVVQAQRDRLERAGEQVAVIEQRLSALADA